MRGDRYEMDFSRRLKVVRESRHLSRTELADRLGLTYWTVAKYEQGKRRPDHDELSKLAATLRVSTDYLLGLSNDPTLPSGHDDNADEAIAILDDDDPMADLPEPARKSLNDFIAYIRQKYSKKDN